MHVLDAIRSRRTVKAFEPRPLPREQLERILDAAKWAPNHRMTEPWRFHVLGEQSLTALKEAAGAGATKLEIAPTLVVATYVPSPLPPHAAEDEQAASCAIYAVLLAAEAEGLASFWRTPAVLNEPAGRAAVGLDDHERVLGLLHFGPRAADLDVVVPARAGIETYVTFLD